MTRITFTCRFCKSDRLSFDATVYWDADDQSFQMSEFDPTANGRAYCAECDSETIADCIPYVEEDQ